MDRLRRLFGGEDDKKLIQFHEKAVKEEKNISDTISVEPTLLKNIENTLLKYVPLQEDDCLSCKLMSSSIVFAASIFVCVTGIKYGPKQPTKSKRILFYMQCTALTAALSSIAVSRFFDLGIFDKNKTLDEALADDMQKLKNLADKFKKNG